MWFLAVPALFLFKFVYRSALYGFAIFGLAVAAYLMKSNTFHVNMLQPGGWHSYVACVNEQAKNMKNQWLEGADEAGVSSTVPMSHVVDNLLGAAKVKTVAKDAVAELEEGGKDMAPVKGRKLPDGALTRAVDRPR